MNRLGYVAFGVLFALPVTAQDARVLLMARSRPGSGRPNLVAELELSGGGRTATLRLLGRSYSGSGDFEEKPSLSRLQVTLTPDESPAAVERRRGMAQCLTEDELAEGRHQPNGVCIEFEPRRLDATFGRGEVHVRVSESDGKAIKLRGLLAGLETSELSPQLEIELLARLRHERALRRALHEHAHGLSDPTQPGLHAQLAEGLRVLTELNQSRLGSSDPRDVLRADAALRADMRRFSRLSPDLLRANPAFAESVARLPGQLAEAEATQSKPAFTQVDTAGWGQRLAVALARRLKEVSRDLSRAEARDEQLIAYGEQLVAQHVRVLARRSDLEREAVVQSKWSSRIQKRAAAIRKRIAGLSAGGLHYEALKRDLVATQEVLERSSP